MHCAIRHHPNLITPRATGDQVSPPNLVNVVAIARVLQPVEGDRLAWVLVCRGRGGKLAKAFRQALIRR